MPEYSIPVDAERIDNAAPDAPVAIIEHLTDAGYQVTSVTLQRAPEPAVIVESDRDPSAEFANWTPQPSKAQQKQDQAKNTFKQFHDAIGAAQTPSLAQTQKALDALGEIIFAREQEF